MQMKFSQFVLMVALITSSSLACARMMIQPPGAIDSTPTQGRGVINLISADKSMITIDGMVLLFSSSKVRVSGAAASGLKAGQKVEYTAIPVGKMHRVSEIKVLYSPDGTHIKR